MATHKPVIINELFGELKLPAEPQRWTLVRTKARREKKLADYAAKNIIQYYLPQIKTTRKYQRRKVVTTVPMFSGYIFMVLRPEERQTIAVSGMVAQFIHVQHQQELLNDLSRLFSTTQKKVPVENVMWLSKGLEVEIISGALKGTRGIIESHDKISEIRLQVDILRQAVMVKIDPKDVKIIGTYEVIEEG